MLFYFCKVSGQKLNWFLTTILHTLDDDSFQIRFWLKVKRKIIQKRMGAFFTEIEKKEISVETRLH